MGNVPAIVAAAVSCKAAWQSQQQYISFLFTTGNGNKQMLLQTVMEQLGQAVLPSCCCRFRVNMGNIYFEQGKYPAAIKMYRMALDALPAAAAGPRARLMTNIGLAFVQLGQYGDAAAAFENAMDTAADHQVSIKCCTGHAVTKSTVLYDRLGIDT